MVPGFDDWRSPPAGRVTPPATAIDVWWLDLAEPVVEFGALAPRLTTAESIEVARFRRPEDQLQRAAARVFLRWVLGRHQLGCSPRHVHWQRDDRGRPHLSPLAEDGDRWDFNLSHAGSHVLVALASGARIGVDVEIATTVETASLARICATETERAWLADAPDEPANRTRFFRLWTMKEAVLKCQGWGLGCDPRHCSLDVGEGSARLQMPSTPEQYYSVATLPFAGEVFGAVAWAGREERSIRGWRAPSGWLEEAGAD